MRKKLRYFSAKNKKSTKHKEDGNAGNDKNALLDIQITNSKITEVKSFL